MKKLAIVGKGTAGAIAAAHFTRWMKDAEIEWHYDPNIPTQAVGEGSVLTLPTTLFQSLDFNYIDDLTKVDGSFKTGIYKEGWGKEGKKFYHTFPPPHVAMHFNAVKLQQFIFDKLKDRVKIVEHNVDSNNIDADYVMDCSGKPEILDDFLIPEGIPVNAVTVNQCYWDYPRFHYTLTIAMKHGWVFGIPLQNRLSIGYLYNKDISTLEEVQEDVKQIFEKYQVTPSSTFNSFTFKNYYRKKNFTGKVAYNGNTSFFLEPLEATSVGLMDFTNRMAFDYWKGNDTLDNINKKYIGNVLEIEDIIMMHYYSGSVYKSKFWDYAMERGEKVMSRASSNGKFNYMVTAASLEDGVNFDYNKSYNFNEYGTWWIPSFYQNIIGLGLEKQFFNR